MAESQQGSTQSVDTTAQFGEGEGGAAKRWLAEIRMYESEVREFNKRGDKITKKYRNERFSDWAATNSDTARGFAMFWANIQTLQPTILANPPQANVTRRFKDDDPVGRVAAEIGERNLNFVIDEEGYFDALKSGRDDYLLYGIGQQWWRYVPKFIDVRVPLQISDDASQYTSEDGTSYPADDKAVQSDEDGAYTTERELDTEQVVCDYVNWKDWGRSPGARKWSEVYCVWRRAYMDRAELVERFGDVKGKAVTLDHEPPKGTWGNESEKSFFKKATVYEIWDKSKREVIWLAKNSSDPGLLDKRADPLKIKGFFPCPRPLLGTTTSDKFQPVPDFLMYQDQAQELDRLTQRIYALIEAIKVKGLYAGNLPEIADLLNDAQELDMTPVAESIVAMINGDLSKSVWMWPIETMVAALNELIAARNVVKQDAYEITGLSDILRGASDPKETLGAQQLKVQSGSIRVRDRQQEMARWIRDGLRIAFDIIFNQFSPDTVAMMCDLPGIKEASQPSVPPQPPQMGHNGGPPMDSPQPPMPAQGMPPGAPGAPTPMGQPAPMPGGPNPQAPGTMPHMLPGVPQGIPIQPQLPPPPTIGELAIKLLQDPTKRQFRIDIETDSTIEVDQNAEKAARSEFVTAVGQFIEGAAPILAQAPEFIPMFGEMLLFAVRGFKAGDQLESVIEKSMEALAARAKQQAANPPPDPEMVKAQAAAQALQQKAQIDAQKSQADAQAAQQQAATEGQARQQEVAVAGQKAQVEMQLEAFRAENEKMLGAMELQLKQIQLAIEAKKLEQADAGIATAQAGVETATAHAKAAKKQANAPVNGGAE